MSDETKIKESDLGENLPMGDEERKAPDTDGAQAQGDNIINSEQELTTPIADDQESNDAAEYEVAGDEFAEDEEAYAFDSMETSFDEDEDDEEYIKPEKKRKKDSKTVLTSKRWFGLIFWLLIPVLNIILLFVWSFTSKNENKRNFSRALLLWVLIIAVVMAVFAAVFSNVLLEILGGSSV